MSKKALRSIYLDIEQIERLKKLSAQTRVPQAVLYKRRNRLRAEKTLRKNKKEEKQTRSQTQ